MLDPGDRIIFYGRALADNKFTDENVYWLRFGLRGEPDAGLENPAWWNATERRKRET